MPESDVAAEGASTEAASGIEALDAENGLSEGAASEAAESSEDDSDLYSVVVGGKEERVSLDDLQKSYMRQADYTRKTQEVAAQRNELQQMFMLQRALENDPRTTLATLASALGVDLGQGAPAVSEVDDDPIAALTAKIDGLSNTFSTSQQAQFRAQQEQHQQLQLQQEIQRETNDLKSLHGDFDEQALWQYAFDHGTPNLEIAYNAWQFEQQRHAAAAERNKTIAAKRNAQTVSGGVNTAAGATTSGNGTGRMSLREAYQAAVAAAS